MVTEVFFNFSFIWNHFLHKETAFCARFLD